MGEFWGDFASGALQGLVQFQQQRQQQQQQAQEYVLRAQLAQQEAQQKFAYDQQLKNLQYQNDLQLQNANRAHEVFTGSLGKIPGATFQGPGYTPPPNDPVMPFGTRNSFVPPEVLGRLQYPGLGQLSVTRDPAAQLMAQKVEEAKLQEAQNKAVVQNAIAQMLSGTQTNGFPGSTDAMFGAAPQKMPQDIKVNSDGSVSFTVNPKPSEPEIKRQMQQEKVDEQMGNLLQIYGEATAERPAEGVLSKLPFGYKVSGGLAKSASSSGIQGYPATGAYEAQADALAYALADLGSETGSAKADKAKAYRKLLPNLTDSPDDATKKIESLKALIKKPGAKATAPTGKKYIRTGTDTATGKRVGMLPDGTIEEIR